MGRVTLDGLHQPCHDDLRASCLGMYTYSYIESEQGVDNEAYRLLGFSVIPR